MDIVTAYRAADHRRAELVSGGRLLDVGQVPAIRLALCTKKVAFNIKTL